jgi:hypothetical protein
MLIKDYQVNNYLHHFYEVIAFVARYNLHTLKNNMYKIYTELIELIMLPLQIFLNLNYYSYIIILHKLEI